MMLNDRQRRLVQRHLSPRTGDELDPPTCTLTLSKRQLAFVLQAIEHFHATRCPLEERGTMCEAMVWYESPATGAIEWGCPASCVVWARYLADQVVPAAFPLPVDRQLPVDR